MRPLWPIGFKVPTNRHLGYEVSGRQHFPSGHACARTRAGDEQLKVAAAPLRTEHRSGIRLIKGDRRLGYERRRL
jgi:hypothetical protein